MGEEFIPQYSELPGTLTSSQSSEGATLTSSQSNEGPPTMHQHLNESSLGTDVSIQNLTNDGDNSKDNSNNELFIKLDSIDSEGSGDGDDAGSQKLSSISTDHFDTLVKARKESTITEHDFTPTRNSVERNFVETISNIIPDYTKETLIVKSSRRRRRKNKRRRRKKKKDRFGHRTRMKRATAGAFQETIEESDHLFYKDDRHMMSFGLEEILRVS